MEEILPIDETFGSQMLPILENSPIDSNGLSLVFDKSPDIFAISRMKYHDCIHLGFFSRGILKGFASMGYFDAYFKGQRETFFMLYNFYLLPEIRGKKLPERAMKQFFSDARQKTRMGLAVILKGNKQAESFIGREGYDWMPPSRIMDDLTTKTIIFSLPKRNRTGYLVRNAGKEDIPEMIKLLNEEHRKRDFGTVFDPENFQYSLDQRGLEIENYYVALNKKGKINGVCLAWDCSSFRRTRVLKYASEFYPVLLGYQALSNIFPMAPFPQPGECFRELTLTDYAALDRDVTVMHALLSEIYHRHLNRKFHFMNFASCSRDELLKAARGFWCREVVSHMVFSSFDRNHFCIQPDLPYIDIAFL